MNRLRLAILTFVLGGCPSQKDGPKPVVSMLAPEAACSDQLPTRIVLSGQGLSPLTDNLLNTSRVELPQITLTRTSDLDGNPTHDAIVVPSDDETWSSQQSMAFSVCPPGVCSKLTPPLTDFSGPILTGLYSVTVKNKNGKSSELPQALTIVPPPIVTRVDADLACEDKDSTVTVTGDYFIRYAGAMGTVTVGSKAFPIASLAMCRALPSPTDLKLEACKQATVTIPKGSFLQGTYPISVTGPAPVGCSSPPPSSPVTLTLVRGPTVASAAPNPVCDAQGDQTIVVTGADLAGVDAATPTVQVGTKTFSGGVLSMCTPVTGTGLRETVKQCARLTFTIKKADLPPTMSSMAAMTYALTVTNPPPADCTSAPPINLTVSPPPAITSVMPATICTGGGTLTLTGTSFEMGATATVGTRASTSVAVNAGGTSAVATFGAGPLGGPFPVTLHNPSGCSATASQLVNVVAGPILVFADPGVAWNGMSTPITLYLANVTGAIASVGMTLNGSGNSPTPLTFTMAGSHPVAVIPSATAAGSYDLVATDASGCPAVLANAVRVTATQTLTLGAITPSFGWTSSTTDVTITATGAGFGPLPKVYLVRGGASTLVGSVAVSSSAVLTGVVPSGLAVGKYDVVVVNPDGTVGVLVQAFTVDANPPPVVTSITPNQAANNTAGLPLVITGQNFRAPAVELRCVDVAGASLAPIAMAGITFTATTINGTVNTPAVAANCIVHVTDTDDGSTTDFASLVITTPSNNLTAFVGGPMLATGRRALGVASGGPTNAARFVYAIAGDNGTSALASVEVLPVDIFGKPGTAGFFTQRNAIQQARTQTKAVKIGRFLYLVGGGSSLATTSALDTVERAVILDGSTAPTNLNVDLNVSTASGVAGGIYFYRVAAVMAPGDAFNPSGESLPSAVFGVNLPAIGAGFFLQVVLSWNAVPGAVGYRIYRTAANQPASGATLLADTTGALPASVTCSGATTCTDAGATPGAQRPHPIGSTGTWATITPRLSTPRQGAGVTWAPDPTNPTTSAYIYVFGGLDATGAVLASSELLPITIAGDGSQTFGSFTATTAPLSAARWRLGGWTVTPRDSAAVGTNTYVWAGGGSPSTTMPAATLVANIDGAQVLPGGQLSAFSAAGLMNAAAAGYAAFTGGDFLYAIGGQGDIANVQTMSAALSPGPPPALGNIQAFTPGLTTARIDVGATVQSGYFYVLGGTTTGGGVLRSTEYVLY